MPEIALLDDDGVLIAVEHCDADRYKTDPVAKTVMLSDGHDVRKMIKLYRWNFTKNTFIPLSTEPLDEAERDTSELVEGILDAIEDIDDWAAAVAERVRDKDNRKGPQLRLSARTKRTFTQFRRHHPRRKQPSAVANEVTADIDMVVE